MAGWIKIHRDLSQHWLSQDMEKLGRWIDLLLLANYEDNKVLIGEHLVPLKRGQMLISFSFLSKRWNCSKSTASKFIELLESDNMVERTTERRMTILSICNYDSYQQRDEQSPNDIANDVRTMSERCPNETKKEEEIKEINITTTAHTHTCTCEEYAQRYRAENNWQEIALMLHTSTESCQSLFSEFVSFQKHDGKTWNNYNDFKRHFRIWAGKRDKPKEQKKPKVKTGADVLREMGL